MSTPFRPCSRTDGLLTEQLDDELLVYNDDNHQATRLNQTAALVWRHADGTRSIADLVEALRPQIDLADEDLVLVTLDQLYEHGLIASGYAPRPADQMRLSRRRFIRRVGVVGTAAVALPVVTSIVAPIASAAASTCYCYGCYGKNAKASSWRVKP